MIEFYWVIKINNLTRICWTLETYLCSIWNILKKKTTFSDIQLLLETFPLEQPEKLCLVSKWTSQNPFVHRKPPGCLLMPKVLLNLYHVTCFYLETNFCTLPIWWFLLLFHLSFHICKPSKKLSIWTKHHYICHVNTKHTNYQFLLMSILNTLNQRVRSIGKFRFRFYPDFPIEREIRKWISPPRNPSARIISTR